MKDISKEDIERITDYIFVSDSPSKSDAIFVVGGSLPDAAQLAASLYIDGYSDKIFIGGKYSVKRDGFPLPEYETEYDFYKEILLKNGVDEADIYGEARSGYTKQNAEFAKQAVEEAKISIKTAIIICKSFHARRCLLFYQMYFPDVEFKVVTFDGFDISRDNWFYSDYPQQRVLGELRRIKEQVPDEMIPFELEEML